MYVACPSCRRTFQCVGHAAAFQCPFCGVAVEIPMEVGPAISTLHATAEPVSGTPSAELPKGDRLIEQADWYFAKDGRQFGPVPWQQLQEFAIAGQLRPSDLIWKAGMPEWLPASTIPELFHPGSWNEVTTASECRSVASVPVRRLERFLRRYTLPFLLSFVLFWIVLVGVGVLVTPPGPPEVTARAAQNAMNLVSKFFALPIAVAAFPFFVRLLASPSERAELANAEKRVQQAVANQPSLTIREILFGIIAVIVTFLVVFVVGTILGS